MHLKLALLTMCAVAALCARISFSQAQPKPSVSPNPLSAEQLAIYHAVVSSWMGKNKRKVNLANQTDFAGGIDAEESKDCGKGLELEPPSPTVHRIRPEDADQIASGRFQIIDPHAGSDEVSRNDPENSIHDPKSIDKAVENGFAHGLFSLGEIQFDKGHTHAIVSFSFVCGGLCGHGATLVMKKTSKGWERSNDCENWISDASPIPNHVTQVKPA